MRSTVMLDRDARRTPRRESGDACVRTPLDGAGRRSIVAPLRPARWLAREGSSPSVGPGDHRRGTKMEHTIGKIRIYEIAHELGMTTDEVLGKLRARGELVTSASSTVHASVAEALGAKIRAERIRPATPAVAVRRRPATDPTAGFRSGASSPASRPARPARSARRAPAGPAPAAPPPPVPDEP